MRHFKDLRRAIEYERKAQREATLQEIRTLSGWKREKLGRAVLNLRGKLLGRDLGGFYVVKFGRSKPFETEIDVGDVVLVSKGDPLKSDLTGTVVSKTSRSISVAFQELPPKWALSRGVRLDLFFNDVTFRRMENAINVVENEKAELRDLVLGVRTPASSQPVPFDPRDEELNPYQVEAVSKALGSEDVFMIHGPPGTGKTRTLTELIVQFVKRGLRVAASADSNTAVDNLLANLIDRGLRVVRIGHPARVEKELVKHTLSNLVRRDPAYTEIEKLYNRVEMLKEKRDSKLRPEPKYRRGLSDEEIKRLASKGARSRGISPDIIRKMAEWIELNEKISDSMEEIRERELEIIHRVLRSSDVVLGTNSSFGMDFMEDMRFDVLVMDEATQSTEPSCYIPMVLAERWIMAGDHRQLPPTVLSLEAKDILDKTLFERLIESHPHVSALLRIQYRMNEKIMEFPSRTFYNGLLLAHESVRNRTLAGLGYENLPLNSKWKDVLDPREPLILVDTSKIEGRRERQRRGSTSFENPLEARIVGELIDGLLKMGIPEDWIGVITPYDDQVNLLDEILPKGIKVSTVDGFQGREKEIIVVSFVRSNSKGDLGFLEDLRRLNVSITRARSKLVLIGDFSTLGRHPVYSSLRKYCKERGRVLLA